MGTCISGEKKPSYPNAPICNKGHVPVQMNMVSSSKTMDNSRVKNRLTYECYVCKDKKHPVFYTDISLVKNFEKRRQGYHNI